MHSHLKLWMQNKTQYLINLTISKHHIFSLTKTNINNAITINIKIEIGIFFYSSFQNRYLKFLAAELTNIMEVYYRGISLEYQAYFNIIALKTWSPTIELSLLFCTLDLKPGVWASKHTLFDFESMDFKFFSIWFLPHPYIS